MILHFYMIRRFLGSLAMVAGTFALLLWFIELIEAVRRHGAQDGLGKAASLAALALPERFYMILPMIVLLASISMLLGMARNSELIAIRAAGRSGIRMLSAPALAAILTGAFAVAVLNPIVAGTTKKYAQASADAGSSHTLSVSGGIVWLRQNLAAGGNHGPGQIVIRANGASPEGTTLYDASFVIFDMDGTPTRRIDAARALLQPGYWKLVEVKSWPLASENPEADAQKVETLDLPTELTPEGIRDGLGNPKSISIWQMPRYIAGMEAAGFSARRHAMYFQAQLALPLMLGAMLLIAAGFTMHHLRGGKTGILVLIAFISGLCLFFLQYFAQVLGERGDIPAPLAALAPPVVALLIALSRLLRLEDG